MEPVCWVGIVGIVAIAAAVGSMFKKSCNCGAHHGSSQEEVVKADASGSVVDAKKEKEIDDLVK